MPQFFGQLRQRFSRLQWIALGMVAAGVGLLAWAVETMIELDILWQNGSGICRVHIERGPLLPLLLTLGTLFLAGGIGVWLGGRHSRNNQPSA
ncbi:MAG: hypothetical protein K8I60_05630 [Anaerolineae bacterium]|nr:hypothetical protein [Anaerolineae bacterium]